jgi:hypothetical protein
MKKIILSVHLFWDYLFLQTAESINNTRVSQQTYRSGFKLSKKEL